MNIINVDFNIVGILANHTGVALLGKIQGIKGLVKMDK